MKTLIFFAAVAIASASTCFGQEQQQQPYVDLANTLDEPVQIWVYKSKKTKWKPSPTVYTVRGGTVRVTLDEPGPYYIVIRDQVKRDRPIGWVDLHGDAGTLLAMDAVYETRGKFTEGWTATGWGLKWKRTGPKRLQQVSLVRCNPATDIVMPFEYTENRGNGVIVKVRELVVSPTVDFSTPAAPAPDLYYYGN